MTVTTQTIAAVGSAGTWTSSAGDLAAALKSLDGEYAVGPVASSNMYFSLPSFAAAVGSNPINSVTIRVRARTASTSQPAGNMTVGHWANSVSTMYNDNPGSGYTIVPSDGNWAWYDYSYLVHPINGMPWQVADLPGGTWARLYVRFYNGTGAGPIHIDQIEIVVDHDGSAPVPAREGVLNDVESLYVGSLPAQRVYLGSDIIWSNTP